MHDEMILSLIERIGLKLPCNSGKKLDTLEADSLVQHIVNAIVDLSRYKLATIVQNLSRLLENISESTPTAFEENPTVDKLQSQLFILKILSACMFAYWKYYKGMQMEVSSKIISESHEEPSNQSKLPKSWDDPPTLDEKLAKAILKVLSRFLFLMESQEDNNPSIPVGPSGGKGEPSIHNINSQAAWSPAIYDLVSDIFKHAGRVIFFISASNWEVVFARIRVRIAFLSSTDDEWPDVSELKLLECSDLDSNRLSMVLQELCNSFKHLKRNAQISMAVVLRKAIWNWIEVFTSEFVTLCQSQTSMDGASSLFDIIAKKDKSLFWPVQTMLLILCPERLMCAIKSDKSSKQSVLKVQFFETLKKSLRNRNAEVAAVCYVDIFKASTYVKNEASALRLIVPDIENELKETLFDPNRPFPNEQNVDQKLMTDCLTALFRISPENTLRSLIPTFVHENVPNAFKLVLVKSCYSIASEESRFPWSPKIKSMYPFLADPLRKLFLDLISARTVPSDITKRQKRGYEEYQERSDIILNILKLYRTEPYLAIVQEKDGQAVNNQSIILGIMKCLIDNNDKIKTTAAETLLELHTVDLINLWGPGENKMHNFWCISSQITCAIAKQIIGMKNNDAIKYMLEILLQLLVRRNEFLRAHKDELITPINIPDRLSSNISLEVTLLVSLCSSEIEICSMSINCFAQLCQEAQITTENFAIDVDVPQELPISPQITIVDNWNVYTELSTSPYIVPGRMSQQRRIRKLLRLMTRPTAGNFGAWEEAWNRWRDLTEIIAKPSEESIPLSPIPPKKGIYGLFPGPNRTSPVAPVPDISESQSVEWHNYTGFLAALGGCCIIEKTSSERTLGTSNRIISIPPSSDCMAKVEKFVQEMVSLLVSGTIFVRETVKDTLGNELSPRLYVILFSHLESIVSRFFDKDGEATPNERYTLFIEQAISVLKLILERIYDVSDNLYSCDLGGLVLSFARYLNRLNTSNTSLRIKKKMCVLAELLMLKKEYVNLRQEIKLRNKLIEIIMEWTSDSSMRSDSSNYLENNFTPNNKSERSEKLHRDLDQGCLKTIVALLNQLPLQPSETPHESEISSIKSKMFYKYFSFFIKLLNRCRILEAIDSGTHSAKNNQDLQMLLSKDYTILALSNLLSANVDSGLRFSLSMGYHEDSKTRTAFMQVLTNILNQGAEFEGLDENAMKERYNRLVEVVTNSDLDIALSLCEVCHCSEQDESTKVLLSVFDSQNKLYPFLKVLFDNEVNKTDYEVDLFRKTSWATRFLAYFAKVHGIEYLRETLQPVLNDLLEKPPEYSCEIYKDRMSAGENVEENLKNLQELAEAFINAICGSSEKIPRSFRYVCHYLAKSVEVKYPESKHRIVGSFIFLRFFNPTLVAPDNINLCKPIESIKIKRALLLVTKIVQNLANDIRFVAPYMMIMNVFLEKHIKKMNNFLEEISQLPYSTPTTELKVSDVNPCRLDENDKKALHKLLHNNHEKMAREFSSRRVKYSLFGISIDSEQAQANKMAWEKLGKLLAQLGPPAEQPRKESIYVNTPYHDTTNHFFGEFMRRNRGRNLESIAEKRIFYESGVSRTIEFRMGQPFEVVVDLTQFGPNNEVQSQWVQQFIQILPFDIQENLAKLYFYNTNTTFKKFVKKLSRPLSPKITKKTLFCCNLTELHEYIAPGEIGLPRSTTILDTENNSIIHTPVTKISHYRMHIAVAIKISNEFIQILTLKRQDLFYGLNCQLNDVYHISDIEDITSSTHRNDDNEFFIKQDRGRPTYVFSSPKRDAIMSAIRSLKARYQIAQPVSVTARTISPSGVPGLCIPANNSTFIVQLSERLAVSETGLTLEFLTEFFVGFYKSNTPQKHLCLQYMAPWLPNLALYYRHGSEHQPHLNKTREIIRHLIFMTTKEPELYTAIQSRVWSTLKGVDEITNLIIDEFVEYSVNNGISSPSSEIVANTVVTLSSVNFRGKIIARLRRVIALTSSNPTRTLTENVAWPEIAVLIRFNLMLSFNNRVHIQPYLPELFHIITTLISTGPSFIRASVHGLIVNLIQSLCTAQPLDPSNLTRLNLLLTELSEPNFKLFFGLNKIPENAFEITVDSVANLPDNMPLSSLETIVQALLEVMICGAPSVDVSNTWKARWMGLVASTAFQHNPAIQPRAFVALGCLACEEVDDDLLYQILVALRGALDNFSENDCSLIQSIIMCLTKIVEKLSRESRYLRPMFWLTMALIQIGHIPIFQSAVNLLHVVLRALEAQNFFVENDLVPFLLSSRIPLEKVTTVMDIEAGINYSHFSFAIAAVLLKGLKNPLTKTSTQAALLAFLNIAAKGVNPKNNIISSSMLGYLAALLPISAKDADMKGLLGLSGISDIDVDDTELQTTYFNIFERLEIPDNRTALLLISLMVTMLHHAESEAERLFLYGFLAEAAKIVPESFALVANDNQSSYLSEIGFSHLMDCGSFQNVTKEKKATNARLS
ncbi:10253_t:CDS:10, partial [Funneliformis geosporum]